MTSQSLSARIAQSDKHQEARNRKRRIPLAADSGPVRVSDTLTDRYEPMGVLSMCESGAEWNASSN